MNIIGISALYHDACCCLLRDGALVAAVSEERFSRRKHDPSLPVEAFRFCLQRGGLSVADVDAVAWYERPVDKLSRQLWAGRNDAGTADPSWLDPGRVARALRDRLGWQGALHTFPHHLSHAASAFFYSGFERAAVLTVDGVGEWATTAYAHAEDASIEVFEEVRFPHSLGLLYATLTSFLGFAVNRGEYKVMGLAAYGAPRHVDQVCQLVGMGPDGQYKLNLRYFDFVRGARMYATELADLFGVAPRSPGEPIAPVHADIARSLQLVLEEILLEKLGYLAKRTGTDALCMAGGVALNAVANGRIRREGPFERVFVQPAAGDAGAALGAAALAHVACTGARPRQPALRHVFYGPRFDTDAVARQVEATGLDAEDHRGRPTALVEAVADRLARGRIVGWFHGAMEFGPRALGSRSILADPRDPGTRDRLNRAIKKRESFRPFAPSVLASHAAEHFELDAPSPFMLETCQVRGGRPLPAITHVDGSARPQTVDAAVAPRFASLIEAFRARTGCPMVVNTSFNVRGEPIVCSPIDALCGLVTADLDDLVLEDQLIAREAVPDLWRRLVPAWRPDPHDAGRVRHALRDTLYTFV